MSSLDYPRPGTARKVAEFLGLDLSNTYMIARVCEACTLISYEGQPQDELQLDEDTRWGKRAALA